MRRNARWGLVLALLPFALGTTVANAQDPAAATAAQDQAATAVSSMLGPTDYDFVAEADLGEPFQVDSGRLGEARAATASIRDYAHLMVTTHIPLVEVLNEILRSKGIAAPADTLLHGAYDTMIATLAVERGAAFDRDYVVGQVEYQAGNAALFRNEIRNGTDPDLKAFARQTLPRIEDHLRRALKLVQSVRLATTAAPRDKSS
jgi:putative membrane protein